MSTYAVLNNNLGGKLVSRDEIIAAVKDSTREVRQLGTIAFNLPWNEKEFCDTILKKYIINGSAYEVSVVAESDPELQAYALTTNLNMKGYGIPIATLGGIRLNATNRLRERFVEAGAAGIEPVEDKWRQELDSLYDKCFARNICNELTARNHSYYDFFGSLDGNQEKSVVSFFFKTFLQRATTAFQKSEILSHYLNIGNYYSIGNVKKTFEEMVTAEFISGLKDVVTSSLDVRIDAFFAFCCKGIDIRYSDAGSNKEVVFNIDSKELRAACVDCFLKVLEEFEPDNYDLIKEYAAKSAYVERKQLQQSYEEDAKKKQRLFIKQVFHPIPVQMIVVDGVYYAALSPLMRANDQHFLYIGNSNVSQEEDENRFVEYNGYLDYFRSYTESHYSTELTKKGNRMEVIYNYTSDHAIIGQMPRDSFYGSDYYKLVMWALVFDRKGRVLIHRRAHNAKDNQGLWDKSVGGHIAITDRDVIAGAAREIAEELYSIEEEEQSHALTDTAKRFYRVESDEIIYLGKWKEARYPNFGSNLHLEPNEFYLFSFENRMTKQPIDSMRILPNGTRIKAKCFVDLYFVIASKKFDLSELKNSKYLLLPPQLIKRCAKMKCLTQDMRQEIQSHNPNIDLNDISNHFDVTPDLDFIINSPEWESEIETFSDRVKAAFAK